MTILDVTPDYVEFSISRGKLAQISHEDADLLSIVWHCTKSHKREYCRHNYPDRNVYLHRLILARMLGRELVKSDIADHIDSNGLNNQRCNLRLSSAFSNQHNRGRSILSTTGLKGVTFNKSTRRWRAQIRAYGKFFHIGYFDSPELAYEAYCKAALELHGEFARLD